MSKDLTQLFDLLLKQYTTTIENNFLHQLEKAKNKEFVQGAILNQARGIMRFYSAAISKHNKAFNYFIEKYKRGEAIENITNKINEDYSESLKIASEIDTKENIELIPFGNDEEKLLEEFPKEMQELIGFHIGYLALDEIIKRIPNYLNQTVKNVVSQKAIVNYPLQWTGSEKNKNEFVQLIYSLHQAGLINNGKGEITKITETLAETFGLDLGKNWQSNHSASIHKAKKDYEPPIFDKIKDAYLKYSKTLAYERKENK